MILIVFITIHLKLPINNKVLMTKQYHVGEVMITIVLYFACNISVSTGSHGLLTVYLALIL